MRILFTIIAAIFLVVATSGLAQSFVNLDFESANLTPVPAGQYGGYVPISDALPGWTGYLGTSQITQVLQNNLTLGDASIDILGPDWNNLGINIIEGQYTLVLQPGLDPFGSGQNVSASVSQTGLVPANTQSLQFKANTSSDFSVSLGGQDLSLIPLGSSPNYTLYGANISLFAGQVETLTISALAAPNAFNLFDSFVFSPSSVPEPSVLGLSALGGLFFGLRRRRNSPQ